MRFIAYKCMCENESKHQNVLVNKTFRKFLSITLLVNPPFYLHCRDFEGSAELENPKEKWHIITLSRHIHCEILFIHLEGHNVFCGERLCVHLKDGGWRGRVFHHILSSVLKQYDQQLSAKAIQMTPHAPLSLRVDSETRSHSL